MYIIRPLPMSTRLAKDSARAVVASEQASAIRAINFTTMCFMVVRLFAFNSPARCPATSTNHTKSIGRGTETLLQINCESRRSKQFGGSSDIRFAQTRSFCDVGSMSSLAEDTAGRLMSLGCRAARQAHGEH